MRWRRSVLHGRRDGERLGPGRYREVRYEELVADPERVLRELCGFLELEWDDGVLHHHERAADVIAATRFPDAHARLLLPPTPGLRDWRREMAAADVARFEAVAGGLLDELGYGRVRRPPSVAADARPPVPIVAGRRGPSGPGGGRRPRRRPPGRPPMSSSSAGDRSASLRARRRGRRARPARGVARLAARRRCTPASSRGSTSENPFGPRRPGSPPSTTSVVGFRTFMRWEFVVDGRPVKAVRAVDTATHPDHRAGACSPA